MKAYINIGVDYTEAVIQCASLSCLENKIQYQSSWCSPKDERVHSPYIFNLVLQSKEIKQNVWHKSWHLL